MAKFKVGDKVRVVKGHNEGDVGVVLDPWWQIAASDWPFVLFTKEDGTRDRADEDHMELVEDPTCEYAAQTTAISYPHRTEIVNGIWGSKEQAEHILARKKNSAFGLINIKLVKRKKAGPVEDA